MEKRKKIIFHLSFWFLLYFLGDILRFLGDKNFTFNTSRFQDPLHLSSWFFKICVTYLILFVLNKYLPKKQYLYITIGAFSVFLFYVISRYTLEEILFFKWFGTHNYTEESRKFPYYFTDNFYNFFYFTFNAFFLKMVEDFFKNEKEKLALITEKLNAERAFLKSQLNPHFLFNTLNNIYSLSLNKSEKAPEAVLKLSELMRYMLYESNVEKVELETEIKYLKNYIELQKIRYAGETFVNFEVSGNLNGQKVAPLLLISFVENAFKHGEVTNKNKPLKINILVSNNNLNFTVENYINTLNKDEIGGVGLENVQRRLNLIYPNEHSFEVKQMDEKYISELNIIL